MSNKNIRQTLELIFGSSCFVTGRMDKKTYHHLVQKCLGGETSIENGIVLNLSFHIWLHNLERKDYGLFILINECISLAKKVIDVENEELMSEWEEVKLRLSKESK